jgi:histidinol dehydrogenase
MAYGTETIRKVDKIFGPGNRYVLKAKQLVCREGVAIDMPAGPSEVMVVADSTAKVPFIVADLLSQAEHGPDSQVILVCQDLSMAREVQREINDRKALLPREGIVDKALTDSRIVVFSNLADGIEFANAYAPEHLILSVADPESLVSKVTAAGSVFMGHYSPESAGDYASGTNHILPTKGTAVAWSGVGVDTFMHAITFQSLSKEGLSRIGGAIITMAEAEGLKAHAEAVRVRLDEGRK